MKKSESRLIKQRAEAIAYLFLSEYDNLEISRNVGPQFTFDFLINIKSDSNIIGKFGLELKARKHMESKSIYLGLKLKDLIPIEPIPVILFFIDISSKNIYFDWLKKPIAERGRYFISDYNYNPKVTLIDNVKFNSCLERIVEYYKNTPSLFNK